MKRKMTTAIVLISAVLICTALYNGNQLRIIEIEQRIAINATPEKVYSMISQLKNYPKWSPFLAQDPTQQYSVKGADGQVGAQYHWEGNKGDDLGYQEIASLVPNTRVGFLCVIQKPFKARPTFDYLIIPNANHVTVEQKFRLESGLVDAIFLWLFRVKPQMATTNQQGLALLKTACETED